MDDAATDRTVDSSPDASSGPTWYEDVAPVVYEQCVSCHQPGAIAPFSLVSYEEAQLQATRMAVATQDRTMPPWLARDDGSCNSYDESRWLSEDEIQLFADWLAAGTPMGDPANAPAMPADPPSLQDVTHTWDMGGTYTPDATVSDDYRCFNIDSATIGEGFITGFEVKPGEPSVVHHLIVFAIDDPTAQAAARAQDEADPDLGYSCFGTESRLVAPWAPGTGPTYYPDGTGIEVGPDSLLFMQVHYNLAAGPRPDRTVVDVHIEPTVARPARVAGVRNGQLVLPPRMPLIETSAVWTPQIRRDVTIYGVFPHMHTLGRTLRVDRMRADGTESCLVDVNEWDFNWQQFYFYRDPVIINPGDQFRITCGFETTERNETTTWGEGSEDEMCLNYLYFVP